MAVARAYHLPELETPLAVDFIHTHAVGMMQLGAGGTGSRGIATRGRIDAIVFRTLAVSMLLLVACQSEDESLQQQQQPNVILILLDTVRADHLGMYGYAGHTSPNLDALARDGVVYDRIISSSPWTVPAMGSIFTSTYPSEHHAGERPGGAAGSTTPANVDWSTLGRMDPTFPTIASILKDRGWSAYAVLANPALRGFGLFPDTYDRIDDPAGSDFAGLRRATEVTDSAIRTIESVRDDRFFLVVHYIDPHAPYDPERGVRDEEVEAYSRREAVSLPRSRAVVSYDQEIRDMDGEIGRLLDSIRENHLYASALIVVIADHGEELWDHSDREMSVGPTVTTPAAHGHTFYQELLHVPLIIKFPNSEAKGLRDARLASSVDVLPTILDVTGIEAPDHLRGVSLLSDRSRLPHPGDRFVVSEHPIYYDDRKAVVSGTLKYVLNTKTGGERFIDLGSNDFTDRDVTEEISETRKQQMRDLMERSSIANPSAPDSFVDRDTMKQMEALGYVD